jgi:hypothetical protein
MVKERERERKRLMIAVSNGNETGNDRRSRLRWQTKEAFDAKAIPILREKAREMLLVNETEMAGKLPIDRANKQRLEVIEDADEQIECRRVAGRARRRLMAATEKLRTLVLTMNGCGSSTRTRRYCDEGQGEVVRHLCDQQGTVRASVVASSGKGKCRSKAKKDVSVRVRTTWTERASHDGMCGV